MSNRARANTFVGLFLVTLATILYELLLTRIFSVTLFYHFAFMSVSLAMFGMTFGAGLVNAASKLFPPERSSFNLWLYSLLFSLTTLASFWAQITIPASIEFASGFTIAATFTVLGIPFFFSGIVVCLALTQFPKQVGKLYAADLFGASVGALALVWLLNLVDGPTAVIWVAAITAGGALCFGLSNKKGIVIASSLVLSGLLALALSNPATHLVKLGWSKGDENVKPLYEKWNSFSRIRIYGDPDTPEKMVGWGLSSQLPDNLKVRQLHLDIDAGAATRLTKFDGDLSKVKALEYDITNISHFIRHNASVMVIGAGGGRDVLSALVFKQKSVLAVEINPNILHPVHQIFGEFTGHLDRLPNVSFVNDEARSHLNRVDRKFDIVQLSLVDTFAASSAGAFALTENTLYTREAWDALLDHLTDKGVLSVSRWCLPRVPGEIYRTVSLAASALRDHGITNIRQHIMLVRVDHNPQMSDQTKGTGVGTLLVSKSPFSAEDVETIKQVCKDKHYQLISSPEQAADEVFPKLASDLEDKAFFDSFPLKIEAPTDDSPFFFQMLRPKDWMSVVQGDRFSSMAMLNLTILGVLVAGLTAIFTASPFILSEFRSSAKKSINLIFYFGTIGLAFILVEISLIQKFQLLLGFPVLSLVVTLFTLLISSSAGSYLADFVEMKSPGRGKWLLLILLCLLIVVGLFSSTIITACLGFPTAIRIGVVAFTVAPLGVFMGCCLPLGMRAANRSATRLTPWLWGLNGAASVSGSVLSMFIALTAGISASYWTGAGAYLLAVACYWLTNFSSELREP